MNNIQTYLNEIRIFIQKAMQMISKLIMTYTYKYITLQFFTYFTITTILGSCHLVRAKFVHNSSFLIINSCRS